MDNTFRPVSTYRDLAQFGVTGLTGEACAYGMRTLCDVNEDGKALLADYFGMPDIELANNWNSMVGDKPAIGSVMLSHEVMKPLAQFAFFRAGALAVVCTSREVIGVFTEDLLKQYREFIDRYPNCGHTLCRNYALLSSAPMQGSRNVHAMTGRAC